MMLSVMSTIHHHMMGNSRVFNTSTQSTVLTGTKSYMAGYDIFPITSHAGTERIRSIARLIPNLSS